MVLIRINPTKMLVGGDQKAARNFLGPARSQLEILKQFMSFQNLSQGIRRVWLNEDVYVECRKIFHYQECRVWVRPIGGEEEEEFLPDAYFFVRIFHPGWFPVGGSQGNWHPNLCSEYGQTLDQDVVRVPDLKMDRLIFWEPELTGKTTINPGQGAVVLDVDLVNDIVHYADPSFAFVDDEAALSWAKTYLDKKHYDGIQIDDDKQHPSWDVWPEINETPVMNTEWFKSGDISAPDYNHLMCGNGYGHAGSEPEITIAMDEYFDPADSGNYYHMMTPLRHGGTPEELDDWRDLWCVEYGGDPEWLYNSRLWPKLDVNAEHYLGTVIPAKGSGEYQNCFNISSIQSGLYEGTPIDFYALHCNAPGTANLISVVGGKYFTGFNNDRKFPTFFCYLSIPGSGSSNDGAEGWYISGNDDLNSDGVYSFSYSFSNKYGLGDGSFLITPLERIPFVEVFFVSGLLDNGSCLVNTVNCFTDHEFMELIIDGNGFSICNHDGVRSMLPCNACVADINGDLDISFAYAKKETTLIDTQVNYQVTIPDPGQLNANLFSLSVYLDRSAGVQAATSVNWWGGLWRCGDTSYGDEEAVPLTCSNAFGVIYYLMNPQDYWWANTATGEVEFWDIHTLREADPDEINSYRLLDLEDYINAILLTLRDGIRAYPTDDLAVDDPEGILVLVGGLPKYPDSTDGYYSLLAYGYNIYDGFVYKKE